MYEIVSKSYLVLGAVRISWSSERDRKMFFVPIELKALLPCEKSTMTFVHYL